MSYVFIALIGAITGGIVGYFVTGSREAMVVDMFAGAIGAWVLVVLLRIVAPVIAEGDVMSAIAAVIGAIILMFVMNRFLGDRLMSASRGPRRSSHDRPRG